MAIGVLRDGPDWRDFLAAYVRITRSVRKRRFRATLGPARLSTRELEAQAEDEATLRMYLFQNPEHVEALEMMEELVADWQAD